MNTRSTFTVRKAADPVVLLGCVKSKRGERHPARDLYSSPLWKARRHYAESSGRGWFILSALHGLVDPDSLIDPYDLALADRLAAERREWAQNVVRDLEERLGPLADRTFEVHAGSRCIRSLRPVLEQRGATIVAPLGGIAGIGAQIAWYREAAGARQRRHEATADEVEAALRDLDKSPDVVSAAVWPGNLDDLDVPGLYSWWVDDVGARDLSVGLGAAVLAGRIYAGLTGATKWPSGATGKNTLRKRIRTNHIGGRIRGSTFRLTLAASLQASLELLVAGPKLLADQSERELSAWVKRHLAVAVHRFPDPDALADLESRVLAELDPPLNLDGMPATPLRAELVRLRRKLSLATLC